MQPQRRDADEAERFVDHALVAEDDQPAIGAHHLADEERQEQRDQQDLAQRRRGRAHHQIGVGKGEDERYDGDDERAEQAAAARRGEERLGQRPAVVVERVVFRKDGRCSCRACAGWCRRSGSGRARAARRGPRPARASDRARRPEPAGPYEGSEALESVDDAPGHGIGCAGRTHALGPAVIDGNGSVPPRVTTAPDTV